MWVIGTSISRPTRRAAPCDTTNASATPLRSRTRNGGIDAFIRHIHPEDRVHVETSMREAVRALRDWECEFRVVWPDRSIHWLSARGTIYRTVGGRATRMLGIGTDIDGRKSAETRADRGLA